MRSDPWAEPKRYPRPPLQAHGMTRDERLAEANKVLEAIASHGRQFFRDKPSGAVARFFMMGDRLFYQDEHPNSVTGNRPCWHAFTRKEWQRCGFSHGGTMEALAKQLADFIRGHIDPQTAYWAKKREETPKDTRLHPGLICAETIGVSGHRNVWGYGPIASAKLRIRDLRGSRAIRPQGWNAPRDPQADGDEQFSLGLWAGPSGQEVPSAARFYPNGELETCDVASHLSLETRMAIGWTPLDDLAKAVAFEFGLVLEGDRLVPWDKGVRA